MNKKVILCVDDEKVLLNSLKDAITIGFGFKYRIELAESAAEALRLIKDFQSRNIELVLVIADYIMPNMKGDELLVEIHNQYPNIVKIMLTGQASIDGVINAINNAGLFKFIEKPWNSLELKKAISESIELYNTNFSRSSNSISNDNCISILNEVCEPLSSIKDKLTGGISDVTSLTEINSVIERLNSVKIKTGKEDDQ